MPRKSQRRNHRVFINMPATLKFLEAQKGKKVIATIEPRELPNPHDLLSGVAKGR
jgi:hypothetical protein